MAYSPALLDGGRTVPAIDPATSMTVAWMTGLKEADFGPPGGPWNTKLRDTSKSTRRTVSPGTTDTLSRLTLRPEVDPLGTVSTAVGLPLVKVIGALRVTRAESTRSRSWL